jgi:hypothetical protein
MDAHHFSNLDPHPDPHQIKNLDPHPDPHQSDKPEPDPDSHQFAGDKPKCMEYEPILALFQGFEGKLGSGSGSASG